MKRVQVVPQNKVFRVEDTGEMGKRALEGHSAQSTAVQVLGRT